MNRRDFIRTTAISAAAVAAGLHATEPNPEPGGDFALPTLDRLPRSVYDTWRWAGYFAATEPKIAEMINTQAILYSKRTGEYTTWKSPIGEYNTFYLARDLAVFGNVFVAEVELSFRSIKSSMSPFDVLFRDGQAVVDEAAFSGIMKTFAREARIRHLSLDSGGIQTVVGGVSLHLPKWYGGFKQLHYNQRLSRNSWLLGTATEGTFTGALAEEYCDTRHYFTVEDWPEKPENWYMTQMALKIAKARKMLSSLLPA
jgi:hypothetical protein